MVQLSLLGLLAAALSTWAPPILEANISLLQRRNGACWLNPLYREMGRSEYFVQAVEYCEAQRAIPFVETRTVSVTPTSTLVQLVDRTTHKVQTVNTTSTRTQIDTTSYTSLITTSETTRIDATSVNTVDLTQSYSTIETVTAFITDKVSTTVTDSTYITVATFTSDIGVTEIRTLTPTKTLTEQVTVSTVIGIARREAPSVPIDPFIVR